MGECLYKLFLEEKIENLETALVNFGVQGILQQYDEWLICNDIVSLKLIKGFFNNTMSG